MVEDGVDLGDKGELVSVSFLRGSEDLSAGDDFVEERIDWDFLVGGPGGVVEADAGGPVAFIDIDEACGHVNSACLLLCVLEESADGFFGSRANGVIGVVLTVVIILSDHVDGIGSDGFDNARHSDPLVDASSVFLELFIDGVFGGDKEAECSRNDVVGVDVAVDVLGGEFVNGEAGGGYASCARESSSC